MNAQPDQIQGTGGVAAIERQRIFLHEPGWQIALKVGSEKTFCYVTAPGQDFYHRLLDGEVFVYRGDERLCLACAERRGVLSHEPRLLGEPRLVVDIAPATTAEFAVEPPGGAETTA